jgi:tetratricopeptide (TPR) repeat protein
MPFNLDLTDAKVLLRTVAVNSKKVLDSLTDGYNNFLQLNPEDAKKVYIDSGNKLRDRGDYEGAIKAYRRLLDVDPANGEALSELGKVYLKVGLLNEAVELLEKARTDDQTSAQICYHLGSAYFMEDKNSEALKAFKDAVKLNPGYTEALYKMGLVYDNMLDHDKAIDAYKKVVALNPDFVKAYQSLGLAYEGKGQRDEAVKYFKKALEKEEKRF